MAGGRDAAGLAVAGLSLIAVCYGLARFAYGLFVPVLREELGLDGSTVGAIAATSYVGYCVAIVAATLLTARYGARPVAVAAGVAATLGTAVIAVAGSAAVLAAGVVIAGSSTGLASPPLADAVARSVAPGRRDRVQTVVNAGTGLGVMVSGPVALLTQGSWRTAWWAFAVVAAVVTAWVAVAVPGRATAVTGAGAPQRPGLALPPGSARLMAAATSMGLASAPVWTFGRDIAISTGDLGERASTWLWIVLGAAGLLAAFTGHLIARTGLPSAWAGGMLALSATTTAFAVAGQQAVLFGAAAVFGAVYIALTGVLLVWGTLVHPAAPAVGVGVAFLMIAVGQGIGAPLTGAVSDLTTPRTTFLLAAVVAAAGAAVVPSRLPPRAPDARPRRQERQGKRSG
ncbi:MFS transporter [Nocardioides euryhalodurans]|uniref:MFS transporter n=1 Tax=Nocardioides euryhalodurans TaxID=2518370 RepID=A0A4V1BDX0_9ACTN|nr:MFS transporter [Nocardioides euryhalodurans]QBR92592.1 MFS transporter [Nocardioides euryhalodurans]